MSTTILGPVAFAEAAPGSTGSAYPAAFQAVVEGRTKHKVGNVFGLTDFGINRTVLAPGAADALLHAHEKEDEFFLVLSGSPTLRVGEEEFVMAPGECIAFPAGTGVAHQFVNRTEEDVVLLEVGSRRSGDACAYPEDDLVAASDASGAWTFTKKDGTRY